MGATKTEAEKEETRRRRKVRERLTRVRGNLVEWDLRLQTIHADRTGGYQYITGTVPLLAHEWNPVRESLERITRDADAGCDLSREWLRETAETRGRIDRLRNTPAPERDPTCTEWLSPPVLARCGKPLRQSPLRRFGGRSTQRAVAEHLQQQHAEKQARGAADAAIAARLAEVATLRANLLDDYRVSLSAAAGE